MKSKIAKFLLLFALISNVNCQFISANFEKPTNGKIWAVLVAASKDFSDYRHQANVCHVYQVLKERGIDEANIITMMYDNLVNDSMNPYPGKIYNWPNDTDVYAGIKIDYREDDVNPDNFMAIMLGQKDKVNGGNGRVLESTENDRVFVYLTDHGIPGHVCFPKGYLSALQLNNTLVQMHKQKQYKELVFYLETCESGSMFEDSLPTNINVYAVAGAKSGEPVIACFCDTDFFPYNCLSDFFTANWLYDMVIAPRNNESLQEQFDFVHNRMKGRTTPAQYGDLKITQEPISNYLGNKKSLSFDQNSPYPHKCWQTKEIPLKALESKLASTFDENEKLTILKELNDLKTKRQYLDEHLESFVQKLIVNSYDQKAILNESPKTITQWDCYSIIFETFDKQCFTIRESPYATNYIKVLANLCERKIDTQIILDVMKGHCLDIKYQNIQ